MPNLDAIVQEKLKLLEANNRRRTLPQVRPLQRMCVEVTGERCINFSSNDYFGLSQHTDVITAAREALETYGAGAGASRLITGNNVLYEELETLLAEIKNTEAACVFGSGYLASMGTIPALMGAGDVIVADKLIHACMIDAVRLSGADFIRFAHNNSEHLKLILEQHRGEYQRCLILTETIFSMDGDRAPLAQIMELAKEYDAWVMMDDAHGLGMQELGMERWITETKNVSSALPTPHNSDYMPELQMGTLSKATGAYGGYVCGSYDAIQYLKTSARTVMFSTALPPAVIASAIAALKIMKNEPERLSLPLHYAQQFTRKLELPLAQSAIVPVIVHDEVRALAWSATLREKGFVVSAIRPPSVPPGTSRLRITFSALHEEADVMQLAEEVCMLMKADSV